MHDELTCGSGRSPAKLEAQHQNDVLRHLLDDYPAVFSVDEVVSELTSPGNVAGSEREGFQRAIDDLTRRGLLHQHASFVWPSRAAKSALVLDEG